jgi:7tm Chemosensory receptor
MAKPSDLLYSISAVVFFVRCYYVHWRSPHASYDVTNFRGVPAIALICYYTYIIIHISLLISCYWQACFNRKQFASIFNGLILIEDRIRTIDLGGAGWKRLKFLAIFSTLAIVQVAMVVLVTFLCVKLAIADTELYPGAESLVTWSTNPFLSTIVVLFFVICVAEVKKLFDGILRVLINIRQC